MGKRTFQSDRFKLGLSIFWFVFTFSMVVWWWIFSLQQLQRISSAMEIEKYLSVRRMLLWEGAILLAAIFGGGLSLLILTNRERLRNLRLRLFFSNFSHDLKTSLSRLRLRAEVLLESDSNPKLRKLMEEVNRLDLQLENSLWVARGEEQKLLHQNISLAELVSNLRVEWPELEIQLQKDAHIQADQQALKSVFRNIFQNAWLHGQATRIEIGVEPGKAQNLRLTFLDNGKGFEGDVRALGNAFLPSADRGGNGIGLYLTKSLLVRMKGRLEFSSPAKGFQAEVTIPGRLES